MRMVQNKQLSEISSISAILLNAMMDEIDNTVKKITKTWHENNTCRCCANLKKRHGTSLQLPSILPRPEPGDQDEGTVIHSYDPATSFRRTHKRISQAK